MISNQLRKGTIYIKSAFDKKFDDFLEQCDEAQKCDKKRMKRKILILGCVVIPLWTYILGACGSFVLIASVLLIYWILLLLTHLD